MDQFYVRRRGADQLHDRRDVAAQLEFSITHSVLCTEQLHGQEERRGEKCDQEFLHVDDATRPPRLRLC